jgi:hypothetical protein
MVDSCYARLKWRLANDADSAKFEGGTLTVALRRR